LFDHVQAGNVRELRLIIKADVQGSLEPIVSSLQEMSATDDEGKIKVTVVHSGTGNISESDVMLAGTSGAIVLGFNVKPDSAAQKLAEKEHVSIRYYDIIYRLIEDVEKSLKGMLQPEEREVVLGKAEVRAIFKVRKLGSIAGCRVIDGEIKRNAKVRVMRGKEEIFAGEIGSLKHEKDDVREVRKGFECGIGVKNFSDFEENDIIECFKIEMVSAEL
jgi:translation initiation factor IF-2